MSQDNWRWLGRYLVVMVLAIALGAAIGELTLFKQTTVGTPKLTASALVQFMGYGGALLLFWFTGQRAALHFRLGAGKIVFLGYIVLPFVTLLTLAAAYQVILNILHPFLESVTRTVYNWFFVVAITSAALWLMIALFRHSEPLMAVIFPDAPRVSPPESTPCNSCGAMVATDDQYCRACGTKRH